MKLRHAIPAGIADAGFASLAALGMGLFAARYFVAAELGIYSLFFTAFVTATLLSKQLVFVPAEVEAMSYTGRVRLGVLRQALRLSVIPTVCAAVIATLLATAVAGDTTTVVTPLAVTMGIAAMISPMQDHVRRLLHLANMSWHAAGVSFVQLVGILAGISLLRGSGVRDAWIPFGALAIANALSLTYGLAVVWWFWQGAAYRRLTFRGLAQSGTRLVVVGLVPALTAFVVAAIVVHVADAAAMGHAEAARIMSRPILVIGVGLGSALRPRSMEAAVSSNEPAARTVRRVFAVATAVASLVYLAYAAIDWKFNVLASIAPNAYAVSGLVGVSILAAAAEGVTRPYNFELTAARRETSLARVEVAGNTVRGATAAVAAAVWGGFAVPLSLLALAAFRWFGFRKIASEVYASDAPGHNQIPDEQLGPVQHQ